MAKKKKKIDEKYFKIVATVTMIIVFVAVFFATFFIYRGVNEDNTPTTETTTEKITQEEPSSTEKQTEKVIETTTEHTTVKVPETTTRKEPEWTGGTVISYPSDTSAWKLICVNRYRYVDSSVEKQIKLAYVAGSSERMDSRAATAYDEMYQAAKNDGYKLTPCSGYRSYSTQKRLYNEFVYDYMNQGHSESEAHDLASRRRNPPGCSEHNLGVGMDIICAASSANFQNTAEYAWLCENAHKYGFILRYPEDKTDITGVKFEPWHWRYVGVENAESIKNSGLCLEEYLGLV